MKPGDLAYRMTVCSDNLWHPEKCRIIEVIQERPYLSPEYKIKTPKGYFRIEQRFLFNDKQSCQDYCDNSNQFLQGTL